jgi:hypothetical protein
LRDGIKEFEKRQTQVLFVFAREASLNRHWLRGREKWGADFPEMFGTLLDKHPGSNLWEAARKKPSARSWPTRPSP